LARKSFGRAARLVKVRTMATLRGTRFRVVDDLQDDIQSKTKPDEQKVGRPTTARNVQRASSGVFARTSVRAAPICRAEKSDQARQRQGK
jgi:hypothetical protein